jgi:Tol biopolymer transport system component
MNRRRIAIPLALAAIGIALLIIFWPRPFVTGASLPEGDQPQIAFIAYKQPFLNGELYVYDHGSAAVLQITNTDNRVSWASWSPDGRHLAFVMDPDGSVFRYDLIAGEVLRLTPEGSAACFYPEWSPDGAQLACSNASAADPGVGQVFLVEADGSGLTELAEGSRPSWSPDGTELVFVTRRNVADPASEVDLATIEVASGTVAFVTELPGAEYKPRWSPDGRLIGYVENNYHAQGGLESHDLHLWDGESVTVVQQGIWDGASDFEFSPDSRRLYFLDCVYDVASAEGTCGGADLSSAPSIAYSPDGSRWALVREGRLCLTPTGEYGCADLPPGAVRLVGWRP